MLADLPSVEQGTFTQTEAGQAAETSLEGMDTDEGSTQLAVLLCICRQSACWSH